MKKRILAAPYHGQLYQKRMTKAYDRKMWPIHFLKGDLVLKKGFFLINRTRGKWAPNWEGHYVVKVISGSALTLPEMHGSELSSLINADVVKKH